LAAIKTPHGTPLAALLKSAHTGDVLALLPVLLLALPPGTAASSPPSTKEEAHFVFSWRGIPVGTVTLQRGERRFTYTSRHLHTRGTHVGERVREVTLELDAEGRVAGRRSVPQALWLWHGPPGPGCVLGREELEGREGPHCVTRARGSRVEGTLLGQPFVAGYGERGGLEVLEVGEARFTAVAPGVRLKPPPELFAAGVPVEGEVGRLAFEPAWPLPEAPALTAWKAGAARALAETVHAAFAEKAPGAADWGAPGEEEAGGCLAHALRFATLARARGQRVALVHGLLGVDAGPARPHAWVRVGLAGGGTLDLDPTSLEPVTPGTHLPLALVAPEGSAVEVGERWLALLRGERRVVRRP